MATCLDCQMEPGSSYCVSCDGMDREVKRAYQFVLWGGIKVATGNAIRDQLAAIMEEYPAAVDDEDLLAAKWISEYTALGTMIGLNTIEAIVRAYRKANIRERRRELKKLYPYSDEEEARRQKRGRGGPPG